MGDEHKGTDWPDFIKALGFHAIARGQVVPIGGLVLLISLIWKLPSADLSWLLHGTVNFFKNCPSLGYFLFVIVLILWYIHSVYKTSFYESEIKRMAEQKNYLQEKLNPGNIQSSQGGIK